MTLPFKLLEMSNTRRLAHYSEHTPHIAAFRLPDGTELKGMPAPSEADAIHSLFEAESGRSIAHPYEHHFLPPLSAAVLALCNNVSWLMALETRILEHPVKFRTDWERFDAKSDIQRFFQSFQHAVASAHEVTRLLNAHAADPHAVTMRDHPLTGYAFIAATMAMCFCKVLCDPLGIPGAVVGRKDGFDVRFDPHDSAWAREQADYWWGHRDVMLRRYIQRLDQLAAKAPSKAELAKRASEMLTEAVEARLKQTGQARPAILDNPEASWLDKMRAVVEGARLH